MFFSHSISLMGKLFVVVQGTAASLSQLFNNVAQVVFAEKYQNDAFLVLDTHTGDEATVLN